MNETLPAASPEGWKKITTNTLYILGALLLFFFALDLMISSLQYLGESAAETILVATTNPFTGLFIGLLVTALLQSSSTTTAMVVALVASRSISLQSAIPIVMGANIGTTITSTIVSLGFIAKKKEFRRAVAAGTYHDFFNILTTIILFPLEYFFGFLSKISHLLATTYFHEPKAAPEFSFSILGAGFTPITSLLIDLIGNGFILAVLSIAMLFGSILLFRKVLSDLLGLGSQDRVQRYFFRSPLKSFSWGVLITALIRSSTVTTSLVVPLVAKKIVKLRDAVPFILGANIGTTVTAFIASSFNSNAAISIAIAHLLFNLIGVLLFLPIPYLRDVPIRLANGLGNLTLRYRLAGFLYLLLTFFFIPFSLIYLNKDAVQVKELTYEIEDFAKKTKSYYKVIVKTYENNQLSNWAIYSPFPQAGTQPGQMISVYRRNNLLLLDNEIFELTKPGFCRDGEDDGGKYRLCLDSIASGFKMSPEQTIDSVYIFKKEFYQPAEHDSITLWSFIDAKRNLLLRKETRNVRQELVLREQLIKQVER